MNTPTVTKTRGIAANILNEIFIQSKVEFNYLEGIEED
jgi:hypothetical protein